MLPVKLRSDWLRIVVVLVVVFVSFLGERQISGMGPVFFQPSLVGLKGLVLYLVGDYAAAAAAYREHWRSHLSNGASTGDPGTDLILGGKVDTAEGVARARLRRGQDVNATLLLGEVALERGAPAEASRLATEALDSNPDNIDARVILSLAAARTGASGLAIDEINRVLRTPRIGGRLASFYQLLETTGTLGARSAADRPRCLLAHYHRYLRVFDQSEARPAVRSAREAIAAGDRPADAYVTLGVMAEKVGRLDDALKAYESAIHLDPHHGEAHRRAAVIYSGRGDLLNEYRAASAALAESGDPFYAELFFDVAINKVGDPARAAALLEPVALRRPSDPRLHMRLGYVFAVQGDGVRTLEQFRQANALAPHDAYIQNGMGWGFYRLGRTDEAIAAFQRAISLAPNRYESHAQLANTYNRAYRYREAIVEAETALRLDAPSLSLHEVLCYLYHFEVDLPRAEACVRDLLHRDPGNPMALTLVGRLREEGALR